MKYMGSKRRIWKHISPFILENRQPNQYYVEPFCGGCNSLANVGGYRIAGDVNKYLIAMWRGLLDDEKVVFDIDKQYYDKVRSSYHNDDGVFSDFEIGWVGFMASRNGRFFLMADILGLRMVETIYMSQCLTLSTRLIN